MKGIAVERGLEVTFTAYGNSQFLLSLVPRLRFARLQALRVRHARHAFGRPRKTCAAFLLFNSKHCVLQAIAMELS